MVQHMPINKHNSPHRLKDINHMIIAIDAEEAFDISLHDNTKETSNEKNTV